MEQNKSGIIYTLNQRPPLVEAIFAALQHFLAIFIPIITPTLIIGNILNLHAVVPYLISMALMVSGVATFIQIKRVGPVGSGLLSIQGTDFAFLTPIIAAGLIMRERGASSREILGTIFALCFLGSFIEIIISRFLHFLKKIITPTVTGTVVTLIGLSLIKVAVIDMGGGSALLKGGSGQFGNFTNLILAAVTIIVIVLCNTSKSQILRMTSIVIGLVCGFILSLFLVEIDFSSIQALPVVSVPVPFKFGFHLKFEFFIPIAIIYLITTIESIGDLTATSVVSGESIQGDLYIKRIKGGVLGDGFNSMLASVFNTFPNTTFSQNNGVIQLTGVASRYVGMIVAIFLFVFGLFPIVGGVLRLIPSSVIGAATLIMFGSVAAAGIKIISTTKLDRRSFLILAVSFGLGLGVQFVPQILQNMPQIIQNIFGSSISTGGLTAIILNIILPRSQ
ncbi:MAG: purine/pyrimidine permease [Candidatus Cloacimonetes bacterium]|nr:purine/pyrimidine permease [Candidatus Cloacimonadota bacterium]